MSDLTPQGLAIWVRVLHLPITDRAEFLVRLAEDVGMAAVGGAGARNALLAQRVVAEAVTPPPALPPAPVRTEGRRRTTRLPRPMAPGAATPSSDNRPAQQFPRSAVDSALRSPE